jgi:formamidopyrimidine-DNA glycosylase
MPELPEVERAVRIVREAVVGRTLESVRLLHPALRRRVAPRVLRALRGAMISRVERRGKHQLLHLVDGRILHVHFRMNGDWIVDRRNDPLPRFARAELTFTDGHRVVLDDSRALSTFDVHPADAPPTLALGPEPNDQALTPATLRAALAGRRAPVKVALLDQRIIAGLGNIYAAEALWRARIDPRVAAGTLDLAGARRLLSAIRAVISRATGGRYTERAGARLDVYDREGRACRRCGTPIERIVQAGRSTYWCPVCQGAKRSEGARRRRKR